MAIQRWDPLRDLSELQARMNRLFEETLARSSAGDEADATAWRPPVDLYEETDRYVVRADLPGVSAADVDIRVDDGTLHLEGQRTVDGGVARESYLRVERPRGRFAVQLALPPSVEQAGIRATHRNGVVEIELPKRRAAAPSRIEITPH